MSHEWVILAVLIVTIAVVALESWQATIGNYRPVLKLAAGIMLSFLGGMAVERGVEFFRLGVSSYRCVSEVLAGLASLGLSIHWIVRRGAPSGAIFDWLAERNKASFRLDQKDD
jgi:hypothetical protein